MEVASLPIPIAISLTHSFFSCVKSALLVTTEYYVFCCVFFHTQKALALMLRCTNLT